MLTLEEIKRQVSQLSRAEQEALTDWLQNVLEDGLKMTDEFMAKIARGEQNLSEDVSGHRTSSL